MARYYSEDDLRRIGNANNYNQLLIVAFKVLLTIRQRQPMGPIAMVCGPISSGNTNPRETNLKILSKAIHRAMDGGLTVFSQIPFEKDMERIYKSSPEFQGLRLLEEFYGPIFRSGFIDLLCFIPGWNLSTGATWEHERAKELGIPRIYLAESYITD